MRHTTGIAYARDAPWKKRRDSATDANEKETNDVGLRLVATRISDERMCKALTITATLGASKTDEVNKSYSLGR